MAGPTPLSTVSSFTALEMSGSDLKAFSEADFTTESSRDDTKSSRRGLGVRLQLKRKIQFEKKKSREEERVPPFSARELPFHELRKLGGGEVRVRVSVVKKRREF